MVDFSNILIPFHYKYKVLFISNENPGTKLSCASFKHNMYKDFANEVKQSFMAFRNSLEGRFLN